MSTTLTEVTLGGIPLAAESKLNVVTVVPSAANGATSFTASHGSFQAGSQVLSVFPQNQAAIDIGQLVLTMSSGTGTFTLPTAKDLAGTESWVVLVLSQV